MKQILAILRTGYGARSLRALGQIGVSGIIALPVTGCGRQKGAPVMPDPAASLGRDTGRHLRRPPAHGASRHHPAARHRKRRSSPPLVPAQLLMLMVEDDRAGPAVRVLIETNQTGKTGDGTIFVCPVGHALDIE